MFVDETIDPFTWAPLTTDEKVGRVHDRLESEGLNPEDYHCLGIVRELNRGNTTWESARVMNRWIDLEGTDGQG